MNKSVKLDNIAEKDDIEIMEIRSESCQSVSVMADSGRCYIGIDSRNLSGAEEIVRKAHELGHCETGAFYNRYAACDLVSRCEYRADVWAIETLVTRTELMEAMRSGKTEIWELAEYFSITEDFMRKVCVHYGFLDM